VLSGGERSLTSLALLFAVISHNPPPFSILDEVEAALDEANSKRFGRILTELSKNTQFVIISHNRETMRQASMLYGVTMGEDGISKLLSVRLDQVGQGGKILK
jgi:chromosome segregation protein